jgi:hypothetical protein
MTPRALLHQLHTHGVRLTVQGERLRVEAPAAGVVSETLRQTMQRHKDTLLALLEQWDERSAIAEYDGGLSRDDAEHLAWQCVLGTGERSDEHEAAHAATAT